MMMITRPDPLVPIPRRFTEVFVIPLILGSWPSAGRWGGRFGICTLLALLGDTYGDTAGSLFSRARNP